MTAATGVRSAELFGAELITAPITVVGRGTGIPRLTTDGLRTAVRLQTHAEAIVAATLSVIGIIAGSPRALDQVQRTLRTQSITHLFQITITLGCSTDFFLRGGDDFALLRAAGLSGSAGLPRLQLTGIVITAFAVGRVQTAITLLTLFQETIPAHRITPASRRDIQEAIEGSGLCQGIEVIHTATAELGRRDHGHDCIHDESGIRTGIPDTVVVHPEIVTHLMGDDGRDVVQIGAQGHVDST